MRTDIHHQWEFKLSEFDRNRIVMPDTSQFITERVTKSFLSCRKMLYGIHHIGPVHREGGDIMALIGNGLHKNSTVTQHIDRR